MTRTFRRLATSGLMAAGLLVTTASCDSPAGLRTGELTLLLTDAPGDVVSAVVTIDRIYLQGSDSSETGRIILREEDVTTDLLTLVGTTQELIAGVDVPVGTYGQLRFVVSGAFVEIENADGSTSIYASSPDYAGLPAGATVAGELVMPSLAQTGIKVNLPNDAIVIVEDGSVNLVVDFDVLQSFKSATANRWMMTPVLQGSVPVAPGA